jgi:hypothetical protein
MPLQVSSCVTVRSRKQSVREGSRRVPEENPHFIAGSEIKPSCRSCLKVEVSS